MYASRWAAWPTTTCVSPLPLAERRCRDSEAREDKVTLVFAPAARPRRGTRPGPGGMRARQCRRPRATSEAAVAELHHVPDVMQLAQQEGAWGSPVRPRQASDVAEFSDRPPAPSRPRAGHVVRPRRELLPRGGGPRRRPEAKARG